MQNVNVADFLSQGLNIKKTPNLFGNEDTSKKTLTTSLFGKDTDLQTGSMTNQAQNKDSSLKMNRRFSERLSFMINSSPAVRESVTLHQSETKEVILYCYKENSLTFRGYRVSLKCWVNLKVIHSNP